ncbi:hypothetical protein QT971_06260 [Microcoleus sp. herbarium19]
MKTFLLMYSYPETQRLLGCYFVEDEYYFIVFNNWKLIDHTTSKGRLYIEGFLRTLEVFQSRSYEVPTYQITYPENTITGICFTQHEGVVQRDLKVEGFWYKHNIHPNRIQIFVDRLKKLIK